MPRSIMQNVVAYDLELRTGMQLGTVHQTVTATYQMAQDQPPVLFASMAAGGQQIVVLPSIGGISATPAVPDGRVHIIIKDTATGTLTIEAHADDNFVSVVAAFSTTNGGARLIADNATTPPRWIPSTIP